MPEIDVTYGDQKRDFIFVDDVADAYIAALEYGINNKFHYKKYEVGTGNSVSVKNFLDTIKNISKSNTKINYGAIPYRSDEIMMSEADNLDLLALGWEPKFTIESGIKAIIERESDDVINDCNSNI